MIYICSPFSSPDPAVREARYQAACRQAAEMLRCGIPAFSPVVYSYHLATRYGLPGDWSFWDRFDRAFLEACSEIWVLAMPGWKESVGVQAEIKIARELGKAVVLVEPGGGVLNDQTPARAGVVFTGGDG